MKILFSGLLLFVLAAAVHLVIWRIKPPRGEIAGLLKVFLCVSVIGVIFLHTRFSLHILEYSYIFLLYFSLAAAYIGNYPALVASSPSLLIIMNILENGMNGLSKESLKQLMPEELLVKSKVIDLVRAGMIQLKSGKYFITKRGIFFIKIFVWYRKILNLPKGG